MQTQMNSLTLIIEKAEALLALLPNPRVAVPRDPLNRAASELRAVIAGNPVKARMVYLKGEDGGIKRTDRSPIHDWRELQEIKNALVGPEHEAVELYPAESRKVDTANQYHLWVLADKGVQFPFGYARRIVQNGTYGRAKQRPL